MKKHKTDKMLLRNNERKMCGFPLYRKKSKGRRHLTRCEAEETIDAFQIIVTEIKTINQLEKIIQGEKTYENSLVLG